MVDLTLPDASPAQDTGDASERLVARVRAWQHRHPLAPRLSAADVIGLGVIALPYGPAAEAGGPPQPLFHQPSLVPGLSHRALVDFARRHAVSYRPGPADWPQREVERSDASPEPAPETRYLLTAAVTEPVAPGGSPRRLLIAPEGSAIWGHRPLSRRRVLAALATLLMVLGVVSWGARTRWMARAPEPAATAASAVPSVASPVATTPSVPMAAPAPVAASSPLIANTQAAPSGVLPRAAVSAPAQPLATPAARVASAVAAPAVVAPKASAPAARAMPASAPPPSATWPPAPNLLPMPTLRGASAASASAPVPAPTAGAAAPAGPHYALVSLPSKKRAGAEATLDQVRKLLGPAIGQLQVQIMPSPEGFVVTIWPLPTQADAERLAEVLARRGVPMKWLEF